MGRCAKLPDQLNQSLQQIQPSRDAHIVYYPCRVTLPSGLTADDVYVQDEISHIKAWGVYPEEDRGKSLIKIEEVQSLTESPSRLPALFATELYKRVNREWAGSSLPSSFRAALKGLHRWKRGRFHPFTLLTSPRTML
jgi:hypothetical protein